MSLTRRQWTRAGIAACAAPPLRAALAKPRPNLRGPFEPTWDSLRANYRTPHGRSAGVVESVEMAGQFGRLEFSQNVVDSP